MVRERSPYRLIEVEDRLGKPDYVGEWEKNHPDGEGTFRMFILGETGVLEPTAVGMGSKIEGVIADEVGLSVFSGFKGTDRKAGKQVIRFTKVYSREAKANGAFNSIEYEAFLDEDTGTYEGEYQVVGLPQRSGKFILNS